LVVCFRGSESLSDIATVFRLSKVALNSASDILIHSGFKVVMDHVYTMVREEMKNYPGTRVYLTGHSLGGALATLFAYLLRQENAQPTQPTTVVSFGSPPVGDEGWKKAFEKSHIPHVRVINSCDAMNQELWGYHHTGQLLKLPSQNCALVKNHVCASYYQTLHILSKLDPKLTHN
jgi:hypothetical protein